MFSAGYRKTKQGLKMPEIFNEVYQKYCWETEGLEGIQIAPFHTLAHSTETFFDKPHTWHMEKNKEFSGISRLFMETEYRVVNDEASMKAAIEWWEEITEDGHEGFVVKPDSFMYPPERKTPAAGDKGKRPKVFAYHLWNGLSTARKFISVKEAECR